METTSQPIVVDKKPTVMELEPGNYYWCSCGHSSNQPFCNGAHKDTGFVPLEFGRSKNRSLSVFVNTLAAPPFVTAPIGIFKSAAFGY